MFFWSVPLSLTLIAAVFAQQSYGDVCVETESLIHAGAPTSGTVIALGPGGDDVRLSGEIRAGAAAQLATLLDAHPAARRIHLTSEGGLADEGQALGEVIAAHHLLTYVPDYCVSACTLAFEGGRQRVLMTGARLGFHAPYEEGVFGQVFRGDTSAARTVYADAGISGDFIDEALDVAADDMWYPEPDRLLESHAVTGFVDRYRYPDSNLDGVSTPAGARATVLRNFPILSGLATGAPALVDRIAAWYLEAYRHGWSEGRVVEGLHALADGAIALAVADAGDQALVDVARFVDAAMRDAGPRDCLAIGARGDLVTAAAILGGADPGAAATAATLIGAAAKGSRDTPSRGQPPASTLIVFQDLATVRTGSHRSAPDACGTLRRSYAAALGRPVPEAAALLRPRFTTWARRSVVMLAAAISDPKR